MRKIITIALSVMLVLGITSCSSTSYFYSTLNSSNKEVKKTPEGQFLYEDELLKITHSFTGEDAPVDITIFNKQDVPLFVNWNKSALVLGDQAFPYDGGLKTRFDVSDSAFYSDIFHKITALDTLTIKTAPTAGPVVRVESHAELLKHTFRIGHRFYQVEDWKYGVGSIKTKNGHQAGVKQVGYEANNSPLKFSSYITIYTSKSQNPISYKFNFYVKDLVKTNLSPQEISPEILGKGDTFYQYRQSSELSKTISDAASSVDEAIKDF